jgi:hypothetical protein
VVHDDTEHSIGLGVLWNHVSAARPPPDATDGMENRVVSANWPAEVLRKKVIAAYAAGMGDMSANSRNRTIVRSVTVACLVGIALSCPAFAWCFLIGGAGHGSIYPFHAFFGPVWLVWMLMPEKTGSSFLELWLGTLGMLSLYGVYGGIIAFARSKHLGVRALLLILCLHYLSVVWLARGFESTDRLPYLARTLATLPIVHGVAAVELFFALHVLTFQYARSNLPYRPRMTWSVAAILLGGLVAGVALYVWGVLLA